MDLYSIAHVLPFHPICQLKRRAFFQEIGRKTTSMKVAFLSFVLSVLFLSTSTSKWINRVVLKAASTLTASIIGFNYVDMMTAENLRVTLADGTLQDQIKMLQARQTSLQKESIEVRNAPIWE